MKRHPDYILTPKGRRPLSGCNCGGTGVNTCGPDGQPQHAIRCPMNLRAAATSAVVEAQHAEEKAFLDGKIPANMWRPHKYADAVLAVVADRDVALLAAAKDAIHDLCLDRDDADDYKALWEAIRDHLKAAQ